MTAPGDKTSLQQAAARLALPAGRALKTAAVLLLAGMVGALAAGIVARYGLNASLIGSGVAAQWLFAGLIAVALPLGRLPGATASISLYRAAHPALIAAGETVATWTLLELATGAATLVAAIGGTDPSLDLPVWVRFALLPASAALAILLGPLGDAATGQPLLPRLAGIAAGTVLWLAAPALLGPMLATAGPLAVLIAAFVLGLGLGAPVAIAMLFAVFAAHLAGATMPAAAAAQTMINGASKHLLLAAPLFITAGALMNAGRLTERLIALASALVGSLRGGLGHVTVVTSTLFAGVSGSSYAEAAIGAKLLAPQMVRQGYPAADAGAITAAAAILPNIIPPSVALLILAGVANLSVGALWVAGIVPGLLLAALTMAAISLMAARRGYPRGPARPPSAELGRATLGAAPVLALALLIVGGIRFGIVTPTEAGVLAILYALGLGLAIYRAMTPRELASTLVAAAGESAQVGLLIGAAAPFGFILVAEQAPQQLSEAAFALTRDPIALLLLANLLLLGFGMVLDIGAAILILTPILMPVAVAADIDPVHFGVVIVVNLMIGGLTPPVGMLVFITAGLTGTPVGALFRAVLPYVAALLTGLLLIAGIPAISLAAVWLFGP
jgi:tripartite ATP-independent transporter DctM subunit